VSVDNRGRHKGRRSRETKRWHEFAATNDWLQPAEVGHVDDRADPSQAIRAAPAKPSPPRVKDLPAGCPSWLDPAEYEALLELRGRL
jgi:hypothetical protein